MDVFFFTNPASFIPRRASSSHTHSLSIYHQNFEKRKGGDVKSRGERRGEENRKKERREWILGGEKGEGERERRGGKEGREEERAHNSTDGVG